MSGYENSLLHLADAITVRDLTTVKKILFVNKALITQPLSADGKLPIGLAAEIGDVEIFKLLLAETPPEFAYTTTNLLLWTCCCPLLINRQEILRLIPAHYFQNNAHERLSLQLALGQKPQTAEEKALCMQPNACGIKPLLFAYLTAHTDLEELCGTPQFWETTHYFASNFSTLSDPDKFTLAIAMLEFGKFSLRNDHEQQAQQVLIKGILCLDLIKEKSDTITLLRASLCHAQLPIFHLPKDATRCKAHITLTVDALMNHVDNKFSIEWVEQFTQCCSVLIKLIPETAAKEEAVKETASLLCKALSYFGSDENIISRVARIELYRLQANLWAMGGSYENAIACQLLSVMDCFQQDRAFKDLPGSSLERARLSSRLSELYFRTGNRQSATIWMSDALSIVQHCSPDTPNYWSVLGQVHFRILLQCYDPKNTELVTNTFQDFVQKCTAKWNERDCSAILNYCYDLLNEMNQRSHLARTRESLLIAIRYVLQVFAEIFLEMKENDEVQEFRYKLYILMSAAHLSLRQYELAKTALIQASACFYELSNVQSRDLRTFPGACFNLAGRFDELKGSPPADAIIYIHLGLRALLAGSAEYLLQFRDQISALLIPQLNHQPEKQRALQQFVSRTTKSPLAVNEIEKYYTQAVRDGDLRLAEFLCEDMGIQVNPKVNPRKAGDYQNSLTHLSDAIKAGDLTSVEAIIAKYPHYLIMPLTCDGQLAISVAAVFGQVHIFEALLAKSPKKRLPYTSMDLIFWACCSVDDEKRVLILKSLQKAKLFFADDKAATEKLELALGRTPKEHVSCLLANSIGVRPLIYACIAKQDEVVKDVLGSSFPEVEKIIISSNVGLSDIQKTQKAIYLGQFAKTKLRGGNTTAVRNILSSAITLMESVEKKFDHTFLLEIVLRSTRLSLYTLPQDEEEMTEQIEYAIVFMRDRIHVKQSQEWVDLFVRITRTYLTLLTRNQDAFKKQAWTISGITHLEAALALFKSDEHYLNRYARKKINSLLAEFYYHQADFRRACDFQAYAFAECAQQDPVLKAIPMSMIEAAELSGRMAELLIHDKREGLANEWVTNALASLQRADPELTDSWKLHAKLHFLTTLPSLLPIYTSLKAALKSSRDELPAFVEVLTLLIPRLASQTEQLALQQLLLKIEKKSDKLKNCTVILDVLQTEYHEALKAGNLELIKFFMDDLAIPLDRDLQNPTGDDAKCPSLEVPLFFAMKNSKNIDEVLEQLSRDPALPDILKELGLAALCVAVRWENLPAIIWLCDIHNVDHTKCIPDKRFGKDKRGFRPEFFLTEGGELEVAEYLMTEKNINPQAFISCKKGNITLLFWLASEDRLDLFEIMCTTQKFSECMLNGVSTKCTPIHAAIKIASLDFVRYFIDQDAIPPNQFEKYWSFAKQCAKSFNKEDHLTDYENIHEIIRRLNDKRCLYNAKTHIRSNDLIALKISLKDARHVLEFDFSEDEDNALSYACHYDSPQVVEWLLTENPYQASCANQQDESPIEIACRLKTTAVARVLLSKPELLLLYERDFSALLPFANASNESDFIATVMQVIIDTTEEIYTFDTAIENNFFNIAAYLSQFTKPIPEVLRQFQVACNRQAPQLCQRIFDAHKSALIDAFPFHIACEFGDLAVVKTMARLMQVITNVESMHEVRESDGRRPFDLACISGKREVILFLIAELKLVQNGSNFKVQLSLDLIVDDHLKDEMKRAFVAAVEEYKQALAQSTRRESESLHNTPVKRTETKKTIAHWSSRKVTIGNSKATVWKARTPEDKLSALIEDLRRVMPQETEDKLIQIARESLGLKKLPRTKKARVVTSSPASISDSSSQSLHGSHSTSSSVTSHESPPNSSIAPSDESPPTSSPVSSHESPPNSSTSPSDGSPPTSSQESPPTSSPVSAHESLQTSPSMSSQESHQNVRPDISTDSSASPATTESVSEDENLPDPPGIPCDKEFNLEVPSSEHSNLPSNSSLLASLDTPLSAEELASIRNENLIFVPEIDNLVLPWGPLFSEDILPARAAAVEPPQTPEEVHILDREHTYDYDPIIPANENCIVGFQREARPPSFWDNQFTSPVLDTIVSAFKKTC